MNRLTHEYNDDGPLDRDRVKRILALEDENAALLELLRTLYNDWAKGTLQATPPLEYAPMAEVAHVLNREMGRWLRRTDDPLIPS